MPYDGLFSFLRGEYMNNACTTVMCQCPMTGFFHFYSGDDDVPTSGIYGVNALWRAFFISTEKLRTHREVRKFGVNALWRAFFISTAKKRCVKRTKRGVNALWRAFFISTIRPFPISAISCVVSMPYDGLFSFLPKSVGAWERIRRVSMPYDGLFSFLQPHA